MKRFFITTPIYYMNATPHLGHYYATTLADVFARYYRKTERGAFFLTGSDEHGQKVANKATFAGLSPQEFVDRLSSEWSTLWGRLGMSYDFFVRTSSPEHRQFVQWVITVLREHNAVYEQEYEALYCVGAESFVTKSDLREGGLCPDHDEKPQVVRERNWFFRLSEYKDRILDLIERDCIEIVPKSRKNETLEMLRNEDFGDFSVTRTKENVSWGIPVPFDDSQTVYVWIDALFNYMSAVATSKGVSVDGLSVEELLDIIRDVWAPDVQVLGKDILKFHAVYWPAFLLALGLPEDQLPKRLLVTGMFISGGRKMSKSLGNTITPLDAIEEFDGVLDETRANDVLRYYVVSEMRIGNDGDITLERVREVYESDLVNTVGNTYSRVVGMARKYGYLDARLSDEAYQKLSEVVNEKVRNFMDQSDIYSALKYLRQLMTEVGKGVENVKPWELAKTGDKEALKDHLGRWLSVLEICVDLWEPCMPATTPLMRRLLAGEDLMLFPRI